VRWFAGHKYADRVVIGHDPEKGRKMISPQDVAREFESYRSYLTAVAHRMLGTLA
jgi:predicted glycosyl hydrolase (DUF1957 family)